MGKHISVRLLYIMQNTVRFVGLGFCYVRRTHILRTCIGNSSMFEGVPSEIYRYN